MPEDTQVGATVFKGIIAEDPDIIGDTLEVTCIDRPQVSGCTLIDSGDALKLFVSRLVEQYYLS